MVNLRISEKVTIKNSGFSQMGGLRDAHCSISLVHASEYSIFYAEQYSLNVFIIAMNLWFMNYYRSHQTPCSLFVQGIAPIQYKKHALTYSYLRFTP